MLSGKQFRVPYKFKRNLTCDVIISLLAIFRGKKSRHKHLPNVHSNYVHNRQKNWKEHKCASADECITNCVTSIMEYCSAIKKRQTADTYNNMDESQSLCYVKESDM